jgi:hypothetical protein
VEAVEVEVGRRGGEGEGEEVVGTVEAVGRAAGARVEAGEQGPGPEEGAEQGAGRQHWQRRGKQHPGKTSTT